MKLKVDKNRYSTPSFVQHTLKCFKMWNPHRTVDEAAAEAEHIFSSCQQSVKQKTKFPGGRNGFSFFFLSFSLVPTETIREQGALRCCSWQLVDFSLVFSAHNGKWYECSAKSLKTQRFRLWMTHWCCSCSNEKKKSWPESAWNGAQRLTCAKDRKMFQFFSLFFYKTSIFQNLCKKLFDRNYYGLFAQPRRFNLIRLPSSLLLLCWSFTQYLADWTLWIFFLCALVVFVKEWEWELCDPR